MEDRIKNDLIKEISEIYPLSSVQIGDRLGGLSALNYILYSGQDKLVLKGYRSADIKTIEKIENLAIFLNLNGLPARVPLMTIDKQYHFETKQGQLFAIYPYIEGKVLHEPNLNEKALNAAGQLLAKFHLLSLSDLTHVNLSHRVNLSLYDAQHDTQMLLATIKQHPTEDNAINQVIRHSVKTKLKLIEKLLSDNEFEYYLNYKHLVHGDFHNENLLFNDQNEVIGLLDFEEVHLGHRMQDLLHFIHLACCNNGYDAPRIAKALLFLKSYSSIFPFTLHDLQFGISFSLYKIARSFFLEKELYHSRDLFFAGLIERDLKKLQYFESNSRQFIEVLSRAVSR
ncbi:MAG: hypothetical protein K0S74_1757 [Chlamydiales bacterium]|jgi:Ser/Thr protein kinase RdoA (MazF antagonist)|nr:hypothetical protein [Chlamydiales bacterium]